MLFISNNIYLFLKNYLIIILNNIFYINNFIKKFYFFVYKYYKKIEEVEKHYLFIFSFVFLNIFI